jgi:acyl carrier protein
MACQKNKGGLTTMSNRKIVMSTFEEVATAQERRLSPLTDDLKLLESGLDSLSFAIIVARLEDSLGVDPFNADEAIDFPVTFGQFARLYEPRSP